MDTNDRLHALTARLDALEAENHALRDRLDHSDEAVPSSIETARVSRRRLVLGGGAAALGAVAATAATAQPVAAGALIPVYRDTTNDITRQTGVRGLITDMDLSGDNTTIFTSAWTASNSNPSLGTGVYAVAPTFGVAGLASEENGTGVFARSEAGGTGVHGFVYGDPASSPSTPFTSGVFGQVSTSYPTAPAYLADGQITLRTLENPGGVPASDGAEPGDLSIRRQPDGTATWWVCVEEADGGADARFVRIAAPDLPGPFEPLPAPIRVYDSRPGEAPVTGLQTPLAASAERTVDCTLNTGGAVPVAARMLVVNLTATGSTGAGFLAAYADDAAWTGTSNLNFATGQNVANSVTVRCDEGRIKVRAGGDGVVDLVVDVVGFAR